MRGGDGREKEMRAVLLALRPWARWMEAPARGGSRGCRLCVLKL